MKFQLRGVSVSKDKKVTREERNIKNRQTHRRLLLGGAIRNTVESQQMATNQDNC